jgi:hypothetical protein
VRFVPKEAGLHFLHAKLDGVHVPGSPFKIKVGGEAAGARRRIDGHVRLSGRGLERIHVGQRTAFVIDTSEVGAGTLSVTVDGPSKVGGAGGREITFRNIDEISTARKKIPQKKKKICSRFRPSLNLALFRWIVFFNFQNSFLD